MPIIDNCPDCPHREFGPAIGPRGDPASRIVLVGEAPGAKEVAEGRPFVGPAGDVLWEALTEAGHSEADLFITNAVACQPRPVKPTVAADRSARPEGSQTRKHEMSVSIRKHKMANRDNSWSARQ